MTTTNSNNSAVLEADASIDKAEVSHIAYVSNGSIEAHLETKFASLGRWETVKTFKKAMLFCMILHWAALVDGFQQQIPGNVLPMDPFVRQMADIEFNGEPAISSRVISYFQGFAETAKMVGYLFGGILSDRLGRKTTMWICVVMLFGGSTGEILSQRWQDWLGSTCLMRLGVGLTTSTLITWICEISPFQIRGFMVGAYQLWLGVGQLISAIATQIMVTTNPDQWRPLIATEFLFTGLLAIALPFVPESPLYHARNNQHDLAKKRLRQLYGDVEGYDIEYEYRVIQHGIESEREVSHAQQGVSFMDLFRGNNWKRTLAGAAGIVAQPLSGSPIVFGYSTYFFAAANLENPFLVTVITFLLLIVAITATLFLCEHIGRRPLLIGGCIAMFLFNIGLATTGFFDTAASGRTALGMLLLWVISYGMSAGPLGFVASGEVSTPRLRAISTGFNLFLYGIGFVVFQWTIPYMISPEAADLGVTAIYVWAGLLIPVIIVLYFYYPETYGRTYIELDELYERNVPAWRFSTTKTHAEESGQKRKNSSGPTTSSC